MGNVVKKGENGKFTSKELDEETGLYYFGARYYDAQISKWISPDPIYDGLREGLSIYGYCGNNPLKYRDPNGLEKNNEQEQYKEAWHNWMNKWTNVKLEQMRKKEEMIRNFKTTTIEYIEVCNELALAENMLGHGFRVYAMASAWAAAGRGPLTSEQLDEFNDIANSTDMLLAFFIALAASRRPNQSRVVKNVDGGGITKYVRKLLKNGRISVRNLRKLVPQGAKNEFIPSSTIKEGFKYNYNIQGMKVQIKWHSADLNAAAKYPGCNSGSGWTAQIQVNGKLLGQDGVFYKYPSNITHIPVKF